MFGRAPRLPEDVLFSLPDTVEDPSRYGEVLKKRMKQAMARVQQYMGLQQQRQKENYDEGVRGNAYKVNDFVFLHNPAVPRGCCKKFHKPWQGPFKVVGVLGPSVYRIVECTNPRRQKVVHFNRLKPAPAEAVPHVEDAQVPPPRQPEAEDTFPDGLGKAPVPGPTDDATDIHCDRPEAPEVPQAEHPDLAAGDHAGDVPTPVLPEMGLVGERPEAPAPRRSARVKKPTTHYGDPVQIPETIKDEELFI